MKKYIIALIGVLAFILLTCQQEDTMVFHDEIEPVKSEIESADTQYLLDLIATIEGMVADGTLNAGNGNALISKINNAIKSIEKGNTNAVSGQLGSFINSTEALVNNGTLTEELAESLITVAETGIILSEGSIIDPRDGEEYFVVKIGEQIWMAENLKATKYNDGTDIPLVTNVTEWRGLTSPGYCWYDNDENTYKNTYGALYNWWVVETGKLCPTGWHVPSDEEWTTLTDYLGGDLVAGGKLKDEGTIEDGTGLWHTPNTGATNETGFTALPAGWRTDQYSAPFVGIGNYTIIWSATEVSGYYPILKRDMAYHYSSVNRNLAGKRNGFSVRCLKD